MISGSNSRRCERETGKMIRWIIRRFRKFYIPICLIMAFYILTQLHSSKPPQLQASSEIQEREQEVSDWRFSKHVEDLVREFRRPIRTSSVASGNCTLPDTSDYPLCESKLQVSKLMTDQATLCFSDCFFELKST